MYWTLELASKLEDAPWPATKEELIDYAVSFRISIRSVRKSSGNRRRRRSFMIALKTFGPTIHLKTTFLWNEDEY